MNFLSFIYLFALFVTFSPRFIFKLSVNKYLLNIICCFLFTIIFYLTYNLVNSSAFKEGIFTDTEVTINNQQPAALFADARVIDLQTQLANEAERYKVQLAEEQLKLEQAKTSWKETRQALDAQVFEIQRELEDEQDEQVRLKLAHKLEIKRLEQEHGDALIAEQEAATARQTAALAEANSSFQSQLELKQQEIQQCNNDKVSLEQQGYDSLQEEILNWTNSEKTGKYDVKEAQQESTQSELNKSQDENNNLSNENNNLSNENNNLSTENDELTDENNKLKQENKNKSGKTCDYSKGPHWFGQFLINAINRWKNRGYIVRTCK